MIERLDEEDGVDLERLLDRVHENSDGFVPGGLTRQRRARVGAWSVAGVGVVAAAGLVVSGVLAPDDGATPLAESTDSAVVTRAPSAGPSPTAAPRGVTGESVVYVEQARAAVADLDLTTMVVSIKDTFGVKHPGEKELSFLSHQDVSAGDGSGTHFTSLPDSPASRYDDSGDQEVKGFAPGSKPGDPMVHWYISPRHGIYAAVPLSAEATERLPGLIADEVAELRNLLKTVQGMTARDDVVSSAPRETTIHGRRAVCIRSSGDAANASGWYARYSDGDVDRVIAEDRARMAGLSAKDRKRLSEDRPLDWKSRTCFDTETRLPVLYEFDDHYQLSQFTSPSYREQTFEYTWVPQGTAEAKRLLAPDLHGLRKVSFKEFGRLDSQ